MITEEICISKRFTLSFAKWHFFFFPGKGRLSEVKRNTVDQITLPSPTTE